jgi:ABC-type multidrug transport system permease subunit
MSNGTIPMSNRQTRDDSWLKVTGSAASTWWVIFLRELHELWVGGRAPILLLIFTILLGIETYVLASNSELSLMPAKEMVYETLKAAISVSLFICLILGADSISGERERLTLESLLLTPTSRRQIIVGKFLAAVTVWPAALAVTIHYMYVLAQGDEVFSQAVLWGALSGAILAPAFTALGMLVSFWCNSNKTSFFVSLGIYLLLLLPVQLPGRAQTGAAGQFLQWVNPIAAEYHFLSKILVNNRTLAELWIWLESPLVFALLIFSLLFLYASPGLRLEGGRAHRFRLRWNRGIGLFVITCIMFSLGISSVLAQTERATTLELPLQISIDMDYKVVKTGDSIFFNTVVANNHTEASPSVIVAMNIINLDKEGDVVDPEDWSPERTQYIAQLGPGQSTTLSWRINAILDGDYIVYMVAMPEPESQESTSQAVASSGIHLTVTPFTKLNPGGVLPYAIGGPLVVGLGLFLIYRIRRQQIDVGGVE